jgi:hypothetical protein
MARLVRGQTGSNGVGRQEKVGQNEGQPFAAILFHFLGGGSFVLIPINLQVFQFDVRIGR